MLEYGCPIIFKDHVDPEEIIRCKLLRRVARYWQASASMNGLYRASVNDMNAEDVIRNYFSDAAVLVSHNAQERFRLPVFVFEVGQKYAQVGYLIRNFVMRFVFVTHWTSVWETAILYVITSSMLIITNSGLLR